MIEFITSLVLIFLTYIYYKYYLLPTKNASYYTKLFQKMGYKVYQTKITPFGVPLYDNFKKYELQKKDCYFQSKNIYPGYDVIISNFINHPHVILVNWQLTKQLFTPDKVYVIPKADIAFRLMKYVASQGFFFSEGQKWKNKRMTMARVFSFDLITSQISNISKICDKILSQSEEKFWQQNPQKRKSGQIQTDFFRMQLKLFGLVLMTCFLGLDCINEIIDNNKIEEYVINIAEQAANSSFDKTILLFGSKFYKLGLLESHRKLRESVEAMQQVNSKYSQATKQRVKKMSAQEKKNPKSIMQALIILKEQQQGSVSYDDKEINQQILTFIVAGSDVTSNFVLNLILNIFAHPQVQEKLRKQISKVIKSDEDLTLQNINKIKYLDWVQYQNIRFFKPGRGYFDRQVTKDILIKDVPIKKGTIINFNGKPLFFDQKVWEDPLVFRPERWQNPLPQMNLNTLMSIAFSGGPRNCIGKHLALLQTKIFVIKFLQKYTKLTPIQQRVNSFSFTTVLHNSRLRYYRK